MFVSVSVSVLVCVCVCVCVGYVSVSGASARMHAHGKPRSILGVLCFSRTPTSPLHGPARTRMCAHVRPWSGQRAGGGSAAMRRCCDRAAAVGRRVVRCTGVRFPPQSRVVGRSQAPMGRTGEKRVLPKVLALHHLCTSDACVRVRVRACACALVCACVRACVSVHVCVCG